MKPVEKIPACAVLLAGGRGTRFWPRSRASAPKQLLDIVSGQSMLRETSARLGPLFSPERFWVVTNEEQAAGVARELPSVPRAQILAEPAGRNTAAAIGLAAIHLVRKHGDAVMAVLPADHFIARAARFRRIVRAAMKLAGGTDNLVVLGIPPTRPETGFGYIERAEPAGKFGGFRAFRVRRFTEKPALGVARGYVRSKRHFWNAGMFFWRALTFLDCLRKCLPETHTGLMRIARGIGTGDYPRTLRRIYPRLENISVDYAIMEPAARGRGARNVFVIPAEIGWSDIGSWAAVYELQSRRPGDNVSAGKFSALDASGNFFWSPKKFVAAIGVHDLVLVETEDAVLICPRDRAQDVGRIVQSLEQRRLRKLL